MATVSVVIRGRVQGVGFRFATQREATRIGVTGWVRNRIDGAVEAEFEGNADQLEAMLAWCRRGPMMARVDGVEQTGSDSGNTYDAFAIR